MSDLKSMKISLEEKKEQSAPSVLEREQYPYGLVLHFDEETFKKLGLEDKPEIGQKFAIMGLGEVKSLDQSKGIDDVPRMTMSFQITDVALHKNEEKEEKSMTDSLYGGGDVS